VSVADVAGMIRRTVPGFSSEGRAVGHGVMPFPQHSCMNRYQIGNSGSAATPGPSKEYSANHVVSGPGHHEVVSAKTQRKDERG
jgi:hypothetical protein